MDHRQYFLVNETELPKIFWPAETCLRKIGQIGRSGLKVLAIYDICREALDPLKKRIAFSLNKSKSFESDKSAENKLEFEGTKRISKAISKLNIEAEGEPFFSNDLA